ncbi:MAG TPA: tetratricopeptide repeat protein, partial [Pyrinomonadaceae bacterium]
MNIAIRQPALIVALLFGVLLAPASAPAQANNRVEQLERAASLIGGGQLAEAERQLNQILRSAPNEAAALNLLGALRAKQGRLDEAEALFSRSVRGDNRLTGAHMNLAYLYLLKREPEKSAASLREVLRLEPSNADAAHRLAWLLHSQGRFDECIGFVEKLKQSQALTAPVLALLADAYLKKGAAGEAVAALKKAIELQPGEPSYHFALGAAWLRQPPDLLGAEQSFRQFLT